MFTITKYGFPQVAVFTGMIICFMVVPVICFKSIILIILTEAVLIIALLFVVYFFRDPRREIVYDENILYSPCDGTVTEVESGHDRIRISVFLSLFNVHINRIPCGALVESINYTRGHFRNANNPDSARLNESNELTVYKSAEPPENIVIRQVSGAIARRIVCRVKVGDVLSQGEKFGMIKFGSRTELILPNGKDREICVKSGDKIKAGLTAVIRYIHTEEES